MLAWRSLLKLRIAFDASFPTVHIFTFFAGNSFQPFLVFVGRGYSVTPSLTEPKNQAKCLQDAQPRPIGGVFLCL